MTDPALLGPLASPARFPTSPAAPFDVAAARTDAQIEDTARAMLMDAEFVAYDGMDEADAAERGFKVTLAPRSFNTFVLD